MLTRRLHVILAPLLVTAWPALEARVDPLHYRAVAALSEARTECHPRPGVFVGLQATHAGARLDLEALRRVAAANRPVRVRLRVGRRSHALRAVGAASGYGFREVWWNFRPVSVRSVRRWTGKRVTVTYRIGGRQRSARTTLFADAC